MSQHTSNLPASTQQPQIREYSLFHSVVQTPAQTRKPISPNVYQQVLDEATSLEDRTKETIIPSVLPVVEATAFAPDASLTRINMLLDGGANKSVMFGGMDQKALLTPMGPPTSVECKTINGLQEHVVTFSRLYLVYKSASKRKTPKVMCLDLDVSSAPCPTMEDVNVHPFGQDPRLNGTFPRQDERLNVLVGTGDLPSFITADITRSETYLRYDTLWGTTYGGHPDPLTDEFYIGPHFDTDQMYFTQTTSSPDTKRLIDAIVENTALPGDDTPSHLSADQQLAEATMDQELIFQEDRKRFVAPILLRPEAKVPNNFGMAAAIYDTLCRKCQANPTNGMAQLLVKKFNEFLDAKAIKEVFPDHPHLFQ